MARRDRGSAVVRRSRGFGRYLAAVSKEAQQDARVTDDGVQRRSQVMGHVGQERRLQAVGLRHLPAAFADLDIGQFQCPVLVGEARRQ